ncbi:MAG: T9SS type A sorting domain-containing protein, partial [Bacteroidales bacterium]|nr:T9SS type A sorting domain-containing protein [Bacteroidales bacterium]
ETERCEFKNLFTGIYASNTSFSNNRVYVNDADFENNSTGVYLSNVDNAVVINSRFYVGPNYRNIPNCGDEVSGFGIDAYDAMGFIFENNEFFKYSPAPADLIYTGIHVKECKSIQDIVYNNDYTGLSFGNYAENINRLRPGDDQMGVEYQCNENIDNRVDFIVADENPYDAKIRDYQGSSELASGNSFSQSTATAWHFQNLGKEVISLYYYEGIPEQIPTLYTDYYVNPIKAPMNSCPDHFGGGGSIKLTVAQRATKELEYANNLADYNAVKYLFESLTDGGNTTSELLDVETAQPDDMWALRAQLLGDSPHLSQEVLMAMSDRTDILPDDVIFDILSANPDELKEDTLISFLENKENPLPDYMISILKQLALSNTTYKTILLNDMAKYYGNKAQATKSIVHSILMDSIINQNDLRNWLDNMENMEADKQIVSSYLSEGDTSNAMALLNLIPALYELDGDRLQEYNDYKDLLLIQLGWNNQGKTILNLDSTDIGMLEYYADNTTGEASRVAKNILMFGHDRYYCDCLSLHDSLNIKSIGGYGMGFNDNEAIHIEASPNPASTWVAFDYRLISTGSSGTIAILDVNGRLVASFEVAGKQGQQLWDTRSAGSGLYVYTLRSSGFLSSGKVVVK